MVTIQRFGPGSQSRYNRFGFLEEVYEISNKKLNGDNKTFLFGLLRDFAERGIYPTTLSIVWYPKLEKYTGIPERTLVRIVGELVASKVLIKENKWERNRKTHETKKRTLLAVTESFLLDPSNILIATEDSNWGGSRTPIRRHKNCGGEVVNLCTMCGQTHIPDSEIYLQYVDELSTSQDELKKQQLQQLDAIANQFEPTVDAHDIPDHLYDIHGPAILEKPLSELQQAMKLTREEYEGVSPEDLDEAARQIKEMNDKYKGGF